jgi:hypothetical protein
MPPVWFEPTIPAFERAKTVHASDRPAIVIGHLLYAALNLFFHVFLAGFHFPFIIIIIIIKLALGLLSLHANKHELNWIIIIIWFVRLLALRPLLAYCVPASGDNEDDYGEADGM